MQCSKVECTCVSMYCECALHYKVFFLHCNFRRKKKSINSFLSQTNTVCNFSWRARGKILENFRVKTKCNEQRCCHVVHLIEVACMVKVIYAFFFNSITKGIEILPPREVGNLDCDLYIFKNQMTASL